MADIVFFDGQAISATQLNAAFAEKIDNDADASALTSLAGGPLARTLEDRFSDTVNVLDYLSTTPDGTTDNTAGIQAAINAAAGNARCYFPPTEHPFCTIGLNLVSNSHLVIDGTVFLLGSSILSVFRGSSISDVMIEGSGTIDGNKAGQTGARCGVEAISVAGLTVRDVTIQNCYQAPINGASVSDVLVDNCELLNSGKAVQFTGSSSNAWVQNSTISTITDTGLLFYGGVNNCGVTNSIINGCSVNGVYVYHDTAAPAANTNLLIEGNIIYNNGSSGVMIDKGVGATGSHSNILVGRNRLYDNNAGNTSGLGGIINNTGTNVQIVGNQIDGDGTGANASYGISVGGSNTQVISNQIVDEGQGSVLGVGIFLANTANNVLITSNQIIDDQGSHTCKYGISGVCGTGVRIYANSISGMITSKYASLSVASDTLLLETNEGNILTVTGAFATAGAIADQSTVVVTPVTSFSNTIPNGCSTYLMTPAGTLAAGTLTMPAAPIAGQTLNILTSQPITSFTLSPNSGQTIGGAPTTLNGNTGVSFIFNGAKWYTVSATAGSAVAGPQAVRVVTAAGAVTQLSTDDVIVVNKTSGAATTVNLIASPVTGDSLVIKDGKGDSATNNITIVPNAGTIDGASSLVLATNYAAVNLCYDGTIWRAY